MKSKICSKCHCSIMRTHHELLFWFKCSVCGFTEFDLEMLSERDRKNAEKNKFATATNIINEKTWKPWLDED